MSFTDDFLKGLEKRNVKKSWTKESNEHSQYNDYTRDFLTSLEKRKKEEEEKKRLEEEEKKRLTEDIAPVRSDRGKADLFGLDLVQSGAFDDGYQFGDVTKSILGTAGDLGLEVVKGAGGLVEGVSDLLFHGASRVAKAFGAEDASDYFNRAAQLNTIDYYTKGADDYLEKYSFTGNTLDAVGQGVGQVGTLILTGGMASTSLGATALTTGVMGASGVGSGMSEAYEAGATDEEALKYGLISGTADAVTEMIFGGMGKGLKALGFGKGLFSADDMLAKTVSNKFKSQIGKNLAEFGIKAGAEGLEEVLAGFTQAIGKKATYMSEEDFGKILADENLFEQFVVGGLTSGIAQAGSVNTSIKTGRDFITGLTQNEQTVVDSLYESETAGKDLSKKEKQKIHDQILSKLDKGYISIGDIESALGGESYKTYKDTLDSETALKNKLTASQKEYNELKNTHWKERSQEQNSRLAELETEIKTLEAQVAETTANSKLGDMKSQLSKSVYNLTKNDTKLQESYREIARRQQDLELDVEQYKGAAKITAQNLLKGGMNNTNRVHDVADFLTKLSADKNIVFDVATAKKLAEAGLAVDGKQVNGVITKDGIVLNLESSAVLETTVGHEITHALEGTEHYEVLKNAIKEYAELKGVYADKRSSLERIYSKKDAKGNILKDANGNTVWIRDDVDIDSEVVADLVGEYLFTDADFINNLSVKHRNVFQKVYDEIKYLLKIATAGSEEARKLEEVKRAFDKAYKENKASAVADTKYSLGEIIDQDNNSYGIGVHLDSTLLDGLSPDERVGMVKEYIKELGGEVFTAYDNNGNAVDITIAKSNARFKNRHGKKTQVNNDLTTKHIGKEAKQEAIALIDELIVSAKYDDSKAAAYPHGWVDNNGQNNWEYWTTYIKDKNNTIWEATLNVANTANGDKLLYDINPIKKVGQSVKSDTIPTEVNISQVPKNVNGKFSLSAETDKTYLDAVNRGDTETAQMMVEDVAKELGYAIRAYHGTARGDRVGNVFLPERATSGPMAFFTDDRTIAENYSKSKQDTSIAYDPDFDRYETQFRIKIKDQDIPLYRAWAYLPFDARSRITKAAGQLRENWDGDNELMLDPDTNEANGGFQWQLKEARGNTIQALIEQWLNSGNLFNEEGRFIDVLEMSGVTKEFKKLGIDSIYFKDPNAKHEKVYETFLKIGNPFDTANSNEQFIAGLEAWYEEQDQDQYVRENMESDLWDKNGIDAYDFADRLRRDIENNTTHAWTSIPDSVTDYLKHLGYDGIKDTGGKFGGDSHIVWIPFSSEQVKSADPVTYDDAGNVIPLSQRFSEASNDIRYSLSDPNDIAPVDFQKSAKYLMVQKDNITGDIAPMTEAEANALQSEKTNMADAEPPVEEEPKKLTRSELHKQIIGKFKHTFQAGGLDFDEVLRKAKNLSTFATVDNTPQRVMEKALGYKEGQILSDLTVNKVAQNETEGIKWLNSVTGRKNGLLAQLSDQYKIKPGSKESAAAQMYAEGFYVDDNNDIIAYGDAELAKDFPDAQVQNRIKGLARDPRIRQFYDDTLAMINQSRTRNAYPEIPRLENYFLHFRAMDDTFSKLGLPFNPNDIRAKDLPTDLNGVTADLKPGQPYFASAMHRNGKRTSFDLLGGLERYASSAKNQIYHIDDIQNLRALRNYIADNFGQAHGLENIDTMSEEEAQQRIEEVFSSHLSTFAKFLNEEANALAGKTSLIDRSAEGIIGRRMFTFMDTLNKQVGSNMVGWNVSSALTNFDAVVRGFAKTNKFDFLKAFTQYTSNKIGSAFGKGDGFAENNPTIIRRNGADRFYRTPWQKVGDAGYGLMGVVDNISTELIVRAKYNELTRKGMSEQQAIVETDKWVSRLMGDRSLGQQPLLFNSKTLGLITKFQLEVRNNLDSMFYDTIQDAKASNEDIVNAKERNAKTAAKITSTLVQTAVATHLFGKAFEAVAGYNPSFDILSVLATLFGFDDEEESEDTALDNMEQAFLELLEDLPYTSTLTGGRIPIGSALPIEQFITGKDQYGNEKSRVETITETAPYYLLPGGYGQIKKTTQGLGMFSEDHPIAGSYTDSGNLRFPVEDNLLNRTQAALFGQYASQNARDYFDNNRTALKEKQIQEFIDVDIPIRDYWEYREGLSEQKTIEDKFDYIAGLDLPVSKKNILINNIVDREEAVDLEGYEDFSNYEEFDFATKNPEKYTVAKAVGGYNSYATHYKAMNDISADKDESGKSITGSRKEKIIDYVNSLDIDYGMKIILFKSEYKADDTYNYDILDYLNSRNDLTYEEIVTILTELDFTVDGNGNVYWD